MSGEHRLYGELAEWWPLLSRVEDYAEEVEVYAPALIEHARRPVTTLLELGAGGGNNAYFLKRRFQCTLVDLSPDMLRVGSTQNPDCEHVAGDMRSVRLGRTFDAVFVHDAIMYMTSEADLRATLTTAFEHLAPGGAALFLPDVTRERFEATTDHGGHDGGARSLRYLEWAFDPDPADTRYTVEYAVLLRDGWAPARCVQDRHELGLFSRAEWVRWMAAAGFDARAVERPAFDGETSTHEMFVGVRA